MPNTQTICTLSLLTLSLLWFIASPDYEPAIAFITVLGGALSAKRLGKYRAKSLAATSARQPAEPTPQQSHSPKGYSQITGERLRWLRQDVLGLSLREMAKFLDLDAVTRLERYEQGEEEYPLPLIEKIEDFFRVHDGFLETGRGSIFKPFTLSQASVDSFLAQGYTPILACCPNQRGDLFCYQVFEKNCDGYVRIAFANVYGSFASNGGGAMNIGYLINALLDAGKTPSAVRIVTATKQEWQALSDNSYYSRRPFSRFGAADWECMDIFDAWFKEYRASRERWHVPA